MRSQGFFSLFLFSFSMRNKFADETLISIKNSQLICILVLLQLKLIDLCNLNFLIFRGFFIFWKNICEVFDMISNEKMYASVDNV